MLARYLLSSNEFAGGRVKQTAFNPLNADTLSTYRLLGLSAKQIDDAGKAVAVQRGPGRTFYGRAEVAEEILAPEGLAFAQDDNPRPGHGNIVGWPPGTTAEAREAKLAIAKRLAAVAKLVEREPAYTAP
jgi:hypothetical protein